jgi:cysteine desulfurase
MAPSRPRSIYLDWNATTPPYPAVLDSMREASEWAWANPASVHTRGRQARAEVESLREELGAALFVSPRDVVLTSGGTEANNLGLRRATALVTSRLEHPSVVRVAEALEAAGREVRWLPIPGDGRLEPDAVRAACAGLPAGAWVAIQAANHETGVLQPLLELSEVVHAAGLRLHVDAVQAFGKVDSAVLRVADAVAVASHKIRGPKGIGALAFRGPAPPPLLVGGAQERGLRPGTVDAVAAVGFRTALGFARSAPSRWAALGALRDGFEAAFRGCGLTNGAEPRLPHVSNLSFPGVNGDELVAALDLLGVHVSSGSACAAGTAEPSPVILAMLGRERARSAVRISIGDETSVDLLSEAKALFFQALGAAGAKGSGSA